METKTNAEMKIKTPITTPAIPPPLNALCEVGRLELTRLEFGRMGRSWLRQAIVIGCTNAVPRSTASVTGVDATVCVNIPNVPVVVVNSRPSTLDTVEVVTIVPVTKLSTGDKYTA